jgi:tRNA (cmo5U34)-methyltransferase
MLKSARDHFAGDSKVEIVKHDLSQPLPDLGYFDAVVSSFAIHHLKHERKHEL